MRPYDESASLMAWRALLGQWEGWRSRCDLEVAWLISQFFPRRTQTVRSRRTSKATGNQIHILVVGPVGQQDKWLTVPFDSVSWTGPRDSFYFRVSRTKSWGKNRVECAVLTGNKQCCSATGSWTDRTWCNVGVNITVISTFSFLPPWPPPSGTSVATPILFSEKKVQKKLYSSVNKRLCCNPTSIISIMKQGTNASILKRKR